MLDLVCFFSVESRDFPLNSLLVWFVEDISKVITNACALVGGNSFELDLVHAEVRWTIDLHNHLFPFKSRHDATVVCQIILYQGGISHDLLMTGTNKIELFSVLQ